jgi:linoleoyl-CoA desaturase
MLAINSKVSFSKSAKTNVQYRELQALVQQKVATLPRHRIWFARLRAIIFPMLFFLLYLLALQQHQQPHLFLLLYMAMGVGIVLIFLNLVHEAVHNTLFQNKKMNRLLLYLFDLLGANSYIWKRRHTLLHHNFTNVAGWDSDIEQASIFRIFPNDPLQAMHKHQPRLMFLLYPFYLTNWLLVRDFKDFFQERQVIRKITRIPLLEYAKLFFFKAVFIGYILLVPVWVGFDLGQVLLAFLLMLLTANCLALFVLLTPHTNTKNAFPQPDAQHTIHDTWFMHQFSTTNDVDGTNWFFRNVMANFNFHLAHHLFPRISYVYAPEVTEVIKAYANQHQLNYRTYPLLHALYYHYELIKKNAHDPAILEEDM